MTGSQSAWMILKRAALLAFLPAVPAGAADPDEMKGKAEWVERNLLSPRAAGGGPFSFALGGQPSAELLPAWDRSVR